MDCWVWFQMFCSCLITYKIFWVVFGQTAGTTIAPGEDKRTHFDGGQRNVCNSSERQLSLCFKTAEAGGREGGW